MLKEFINPKEIITIGVAEMKENQIKTIFPFVFLTPELEKVAAKSGRSPIYFYCITNGGVLKSPLSKSSDSFLRILIFETG